MSKKVRVETVVGKSGSYRDPAVEHHVRADARAGLTHRWRRLPAFMADLAISLASFLSIISGIVAIFLFMQVADGVASRGVTTAFIGFTLFTLLWLIGGPSLARRLRQWRDKRRTHDLSILTIGHDALHVGGRTIRKEQLRGVRVEKQKSKAPAAEGRSAEVRYDVVLDVEGGESVHVLEELEEDELGDVLAAFAGGGVDVEETAL